MAYFNDTTTKNGLIQSCEDWLFGGDYGAISGNPTLLLKFTNMINRGMDKTTSIMMQTDGTWHYDDPNRTDIAEGKTSMSNAVANYRLDLSHLIIAGVDILNNSGDKYPLIQIDYNDVRQKGLNIDEMFDTAGTPTHYGIKGVILTLYPAPATASVTLNDGLFVTYQREPNYFVSTDTTVEIGIPRTYQDLPVLFACNEYAKQNTMSEKARELDKEIINRGDDLKNHFNKRNEDRPKKIQPIYRNPQ